MTATQTANLPLADHLTQVVDHLRTLEPMLSEPGDLPRSVAALLSEHGLPGLCLPTRLNGGGRSVVALTDSVYRVAQADPATGWCLFIFATAPWLLAYADDECVTEVYSDPQVRIGGALAPTGRATAIGDTYQLDGTWSFGSGVSTCQYVVVNAVCSDTDDTAFLVVPQADIAGRAVWDGMGLARSGSSAFTITGAVVPAHRVIHTSEGVRWPEAAFRLPFRATFIAGAAVLCGIAQEMLTRVMALCEHKRSTFGRRRIGDEPRTHFLVADCRGDLDAAYGALRQAAHRIELAAQQDSFSLDDQITVRLAIHHARKTALAVVGRLHVVTGSQGIPHDGVFARLLRDAHTASQHYMFSDEVAEVAGAAMLGFAPDRSRL